MGNDQEALWKSCTDVAYGGQRSLVVVVPESYLTGVVPIWPPSEARLAGVYVVGVTARVSAWVGEVPLTLLAASSQGLFVAG